MMQNLDPCIGRNHIWCARIALVSYAGARVYIAVNGTRTAQELCIIRLIYELYC